MAAELNVRFRQISDSSSEGSARDHRVKCDRPQLKGGNNDGPMGGEIFLLGLGGCFMSNLLAAIKARNAEVSDVELSVTGQLDGTPQRFTEISLSIAANYPSKEEMEKLALIAERGCIVANTLKGAVSLSISVR